MSFERPNIEKMHGYLPGEQTGSQDTIKLNTNENPYPASPDVLAALQSVEIDSLRRYPSPMADKFRTTASQLHGVSEKNIIPTNGSDELLRLVLTTFVEPGESIAITQPSYSLYPVLAEIHGCEVVEIPLNTDWSMPADFSAQLSQSKAKILFLVNPHAPTGYLLTTGYIEQIAKSFSGIVVLDEAYVDFVDPELGYDSIKLIKSCDNILILRTLSKGYSLAGLRFGYGIAQESLINPMMFKTRDSYNTDYISQQLANAALNSIEYSKEIWQRVRLEREKLQNELNTLGLTSTPSQTNFVLCQVPDSPGAENLYQSLKQRNILVRYFDQNLLRDKLRITVGTKEENSALISALEEILQA